MAKRIGIEVSLAISEAVKLAEVDVISAYPITPQTHIVEGLSEMVASGDLDAEYVNVESEHSAMSVCMGAAAVGARTFTATSAQGLALMHELLFIASFLRLPTVMSIVNRALSAPLNIWGDQSDIMAERDCGWIQVFAESGQEVFDLTIIAFKLAEDSRVLLPVAVNLDGFTLSHMVEPVEILDEEEVKNFLPEYKPLMKLDVDNPVTMGAYCMPDTYTEAKYSQDILLRESIEVFKEVTAEYNHKFGRNYQPLTSYKTENADIILLTLGGIGQTAQVAVNMMRENGKKVGLIKLCLWRPFPFDEIQTVLKNAKVVAVIDRAISTGGQGGPVAAEIKSALYEWDKKPMVISFVLGLGGRDVTVADFERAVSIAEEAMAGRHSGKIFEMIGVRE